MYYAIIYISYILLKILYLYLLFHSFIDSDNAFRLSLIVEVFKLFAFSTGSGKLLRIDQCMELLFAPY